MNFFDPTSAHGQIIIGLVIAVLAGLFNIGNIKRGILNLIQLIKWRLLKVKPDKFSIIICSIENDEDTTVLKTVSKLLVSGFSWLEVHGAPNINLNVDEINPRDCIEKNHSKARRILREKKADLLVWGYCTNTHLKIFFEHQGFSTEGKKSYSLATINEVVLPKEFSNDIGLVILAVAYGHILNPPHTREFLERKFVIDFYSIAKKLDVLLQEMPDSLKEFEYFLWDATASAYYNAYVGSQSDREPLVQAISRQLKVLEIVPKDKPLLIKLCLAANYAAYVSELAKNDKNPQGFIEALNIYQDVFKEITFSNCPDFATFKFGQANTHLEFSSILPVQEIQVDLLKKSIDCFEEAIAAVPINDGLIIAKYKNNLAVAYKRIGQITNSVEYLQKAVDILQEVTEIHTIDEVPYTWAITVSNIASNLGLIGCLSNSRGDLESSISYYRSALEVQNPNIRVDDWFKSVSGCAGSYSNIGGIFKDKKVFEEAIELLNNSRVLIKKKYFHLYCRLSWQLGEILFRMGSIFSSPDYYNDSILILEELKETKGIEQVGLTQAQVEKNIQQAESRITELVDN
ncbi:MAG: tetratricopeptide repeat protein [Candidatus Melainabacteria bacterium]